jgi:hypothetical protein
MEELGVFDQGVQVESGLERKGYAVSLVHQLWAVGELLMFI